MSEHADRFLPLAPAVFHVLLALADGEKHGYAVIKEVRTRTNGAVSLSASTLYGIVKRLLDNGLIEESSERPDPALDDERRRYYGLSALGRAVAVAESRRLEATLGIARAKRLIPTPRLR
jgi:DNA-binding PadR family transcriptional regulator